MTEISAQQKRLLNDLVSLGHSKMNNTGTRPDSLYSVGVVGIHEIVKTDADRIDLIALWAKGLICLSIDSLMVGMSSDGWKTFNDLYPKLPKINREDCVLSVSLVANRKKDQIAINALVEHTQMPAVMVQKQKDNFSHKRLVLLVDTLKQHLLLFYNYGDTLCYGGFPEKRYYIKAASQKNTTTLREHKNGQV